MESVLRDLGALRVQIVGGNEIVPSDLAVAYYESEEAALVALKKLKSITLDGRRITTTYRETSEPTVEISNLPDSCVLNDVDSLMISTSVRPIQVQIVPDCSSGKLLLIYL